MALTVMQQAEHVRNLALAVAMSVPRDHFARRSADEMVTQAELLVATLARVLVGKDAEAFSYEYGD